MNRILCTIIAMSIIVFVIILDAFVIALYSPTMLLTMGDRILLCSIWSILFGGMAYCVWDCSAL